MKKWLVVLALLIAAPVAYSQVGGGVYSPAPTISDATITFTDVTTGNASTTKHGFLKKLSNVATQFMDGTGNWSVPAVTTDATLTTTDITTNDVSTSKHGFAPKSPNDATKYLNGAGAYTVPAAAGTAYLCVTWTGGGTTVTRNTGYTATITRNGTGDYTVNSGTALPTAATWTYGMYSAGPQVLFSGTSVPTTTAMRLLSYSTALTPSDAITYWACAF